MKKLGITIGVLGLIIISAIIFENRLDQASDKIKKQVMEKEQRAEQAVLAREKAFNLRLKTKADSALLYAKEKGFDLDHAVLIDFSIHSGKKRFFVWDYKTNSIALSSLCAHGTGKGDNKSTYTDIKYSNVEGSLCSSLGRYKIGIRSYSNWGINVHYKLHGLDKTNNNAFPRIVVLHSFAPVPKEEIYPRHLPLGYSQGCPVINDDAMTQMDNLLKQKTKPMLLWLYN